MAVAPRSSSVGSNTSSSPTTIGVTKPTGTADGDFLLAFVSEDSSGNSANLTAPTGWTQTGSTISTGMRSKLFYKVASSEGATYNFGCSSFTSVSSMAIVVAFSGVDTTTPINTAAVLSVDATGNSKAAVASSITPTSGVGAVVFGFSTQGQSSNTAMSTPTGLTSILQSRSPADSWAGELVAWKSYTSATATGTQTSSYATANSWATFSIALNAASTAASVTASGALTLSGSATATSLPSRTASGSLALSGSATATTVPSATASGTLSLSGAAAASAVPTTTASGSLTLAGSATATTVPSATASGSLSLGGAATATTVPSTTASGVLALSGSATASAGASVTVTGSLTLSGSATATPLSTATVSGALTLSGYTTVSAPAKSNFEVGVGPTRLDPSVGIGGISAPGMAVSSGANTQHIQTGALAQGVTVGSINEHARLVYATANFTQDTDVSGLSVGLSVGPIKQGLTAGSLVN